MNEKKKKNTLSHTEFHIYTHLIQGTNMYMIKTNVFFLMPPDDYFLFWSTDYFIIEKSNVWHLKKTWILSPLHFSVTASL